MTDLTTATLAELRAMRADHIRQMQECGERIVAHLIEEARLVDEMVRRADAATEPQPCLIVAGRST